MNCFQLSSPAQSKLFLITSYVIERSEGRPSESVEVSYT